MLRRLVNKAFPLSIRRAIKALRSSAFGPEAYGQDGEDLVLAGLLEMWSRKRPGFYVDVGAHHPHRFSNTFFFYCCGWRGINIDAAPGSMREFRRERSRDINLEIAVAFSEETAKYYEFSDSALNGFSRELSEGRDGFAGLELVATREIRTRQLSAILLEHLPPSQKIDFMTIDVEGLDLDVLRSNNWELYRPTFVLVEDSNTLTLDDYSKSPIVSFMREKGYVGVCKTRLTLFFVEHSKVRNTPFGLSILAE